MDVHVLRASHKELGDAALAAFKKWLLEEPAILDGKPVPVTMNCLFSFQSKGKSLPAWEWLVCPEPGFDPFTVVSIREE